MTAFAFPVGRLAPSPTGAQHVGNARTYLLAWLSIRSRGGKVILRIEDIDSPRIKPGAAEQAMDDLRWLGLDWDVGPDKDDVSTWKGGSCIQTQRREHYHSALAQLQKMELIYPCTCSRSDVLAAASAPHVGDEGPAYPGTCSNRSVADAAELADQTFCWRFRSLPAQQSYHDLLAGTQTADGNLWGDFVVAKSDGTPAYQLAVVVDDHAMGITEVLRGADLIPSTFRQLQLYSAFCWQPPEFAHVPLVIGPDGRRLAKRHGDTRLSVLRDAQVPPERLIGMLAWSCQLRPTADPIAAQDLLATFDLSRVERESWVFTPAYWAQLLASN